MTEERYNEILDMSNGDFEKLPEEERKEFNENYYRRLTSQKTALDDLVAHIETVQQKYLQVWPTGFPELDALLDGGFLGGNLIVLGAISSLGKTTFALQIADQLAEQKKDVLVFSLEMSKNELNAKSISRNTFYLTDEERKKGKKRELLTMSDIMRGRVGKLGTKTREVFDKALERVRQLGEHIYIIRDNEVDVDRIAAIVQAHEDAVKTKPFVIIDYLQILKARQESRTTDKRLLTDDDVNRLKDLAVKKDVPILLISSFNRNSYLDSVSMGSFKESGTIEYSSDTLIGLQYSGMQYQKHWYTNKGGKKKQVYESKIDHETRVRQLLEKMDKDGAAGEFLPIDVILLKNRGVSKGKVLFEFCPKYNVYREKESQDSTPFEWNHDADEIDCDEDKDETVKFAKSPTGKKIIRKTS